MKHIILAVCCLFSLVATAQPTITGAGNNPVAGDKFYIRGCDTSGVSAGASGASVTWDFSSLITVYNDSIAFLACSATPYCDSFPGATLSVTFDGSYFDYLRTDSTQFASLGSYDGVDIVRFDDPYAISVYPLTYGSIKVDTIAQHFDTTFYASAIDSFVADGYGTLILPSGTYDSVLRVHVISTEKDSFLYSGSYIVDSYRTESYNWYRSGFRFILFSQYYDTAGTGTPYLSDAWYSPFAVPTPPMGTSEHHFQTRLFVYPNPASEAFMLELRSSRRQSALVGVTDASGKSILPIQIHEITPGTNRIPIETKSWSVGIYLVHVATIDGLITRKFMIEH